MSAPETLRRATAAEEWTLARISELSVQEIKQLRDNAQRLNEPAVAELCELALQQSSSRGGPASRPSGPKTKARRLIARVKAFEARGVYLENPSTSWGGVRKADGAVVMALWADAVQSARGTCRYLLWAPNVDGSRPWSDMPAGRERLAHCRRALELGSAEGLLVYGRGLAARQPEDKAHTIHGIDAETVLVLQVEQVGAEFWAKWGKKVAASAIDRS